MASDAEGSKGNGHGGKRPGAGRKPRNQTLKSCPPEILEALDRATTAKRIDSAAKLLSVAAARGEVERSRVDCVLEILRERRHLIRAKREEQGKEQVRALVVLTPEEHEWIRKHRAELAGPPMQPGQPAPAPGTASEG